MADSVGPSVIESESQEERIAARRARIAKRLDEANKYTDNFGSILIMVALALLSKRCKQHLRLSQNRTRALRKSLRIERQALLCKPALQCVVHAYSYFLPGT